jgi:hypothetical protein
VPKLKMAEAYLHPPYVFMAWWQTTPSSFYGRVHGVPGELISWAWQRNCALWDLKVVTYYRKFSVLWQPKSADRYSELHDVMCEKYQLGEPPDKQLHHTDTCCPKVPSGRGHTKETGNLNVTAVSEKNRRFQAGNWFPD